MIEFETKKTNKAVIKVIGVGGAGGNAVQRMIELGIEGVEFIVANSDAQTLANNIAPIKIQLGKELTRGLGAGGNPEIGRQAALESKDEIREVLSGADMVFITAGMGKGTGTGGAPVIAEIAKELNALVVAVVTKPFRWELKERMNNALKGIAELKRIVDTILVIPNDKIKQALSSSDKADFEYGFRKTDEVLYQAVKGIAELITKPGFINIDFADVKAVMSHKGLAIMGMGIGSGENRAIDAAKSAIFNPLLEDVSITGATSALVNITAGKGVSFYEAEEVMEYITNEFDSSANLIFGAISDESIGERIRVIVIATGLKSKERAFQPSIGIQTKPYQELDFETPSFMRKGLSQHSLFELDEVASKIMEIREDDTELPSFLKKR
jgi:cell division protein FtsZ